MFFIIASVHLGELVREAGGERAVKAALEERDGMRGGVFIFGEPDRKRTELLVI
jgi:hypothetical protein